MVYERVSQALWRRVHWIPSTSKDLKLFSVLRMDKPISSERCTTDTLASVLRKIPMTHLVTASSIYSFFRLETLLVQK